MKDYYRIYATPTAPNGERQPLVLWRGDSYPQSSDITLAIGTVHTDSHEPFLQAKNDYVQIQRKRRVGWKTLDIINIFEV